MEQMIDLHNGDKVYTYYEGKIQIGTIDESFIVFKNTRFLYSKRHLKEYTITYYPTGTDLVFYTDLDLLIQKKEYEMNECKKAIDIANEYKDGIHHKFDGQLLEIELLNYNSILCYYIHQRLYFNCVKCVETETEYHFLGSMFSLDVCGSDTQYCDISYHKDGFTYKKEDCKVMIINDKEKMLKEIKTRFNRTLDWFDSVKKEIKQNDVNKFIQKYNEI